MKNESSEIKVEKLIETYLKIHVSELHRHTEKIQAEWRQGQELYAQRTAQNK